MKSRKARSRFVAAAIASCLLVGACGASTDPAVGDGPLVSEADRSAHLRLGYQSPPPALNPHQLTSPALSYVYVSPVYDRLTQIVMADGTHELAPMVATEWTFAPDGMSAIFTLREGVTFSDGAVLDSAAVKANLDHAKNTPGSTAAPAFSMIDSVEVLDPTHVKINTNRPAADLPYALSAAEGSLISPNALDNPDLDRNPVGSGPYIATDVRLGDSVTYERREGYWDESAQMAKTLTITGLPDDNARMNALRSGQIDMAATSPNQFNEASMSPQRQMVATVQSQLEAGGVTVNLNAVDYTDGATRYASGSVDSWLTTRFPSANVAQTLANNFTKTREFPGTTPPELVSALTSAFDPNVTDAERTAALEAASAIVNEQALDTFMCSNPATFAGTTKVISLDGMGTANFIAVPDLRYVGLCS